MAKPRILVCVRQRTAVGMYRQKNPVKVLRSLGYEVIFDWKNGNDPDWIAAQAGKFDLMLCDRAVTWEEAGITLRGPVHATPGARMIVDFDDDFTDVPWWNQAQVAFKPGQEKYEAGLGHLKLAELTTVSTQRLVNVFRTKTHAIRHVPNVIDPEVWCGLREDPERRDDRRLRILYGGAAGHYGDLDAAREGITAIIENPPVPLRLICFGSVTKWMHELRRAYPDRVVVQKWAPIEDYPQAVAWGGFDVAIAPLADHPFNWAKSDIKYLEAAAQKIVFVGSKVGPYADLPGGCALKVENTRSGWEDGLRLVLSDPILRDALRDAAYQHVLDTAALDKSKEVWQTVIEETLARPRIETLEDTRLAEEVA